MYEPKANIEAEKKLLFSLLITDNIFIGDVLESLSAEDFYRPEHRVIYRAIVSLYKKTGGVDYDNLRVELESSGAMKRVGTSYYDGLRKVEYTTERTGYYAQIVRDRSILRSLIEAGREIADEAENERGSVEELLAAAEKRIMEVTLKERRGGLKGITEVMGESFKKVLKVKEEGSSGVPSGYMDIDKVLGGFQESDLILLAARPSVGKTALALNIGVNASRRGSVVAVFSLEMSTQQLGMRLLSSWSGINSQYLNSGNLSTQEIKAISNAAGELSELKFYMDDTAGIGLLEMRTKMRRLKREHGLNLIIIDYLQLMQGGRAENRQQEISEISRGLKSMARELKVPVLALSQLSRSVEMRAEKKPQLSDLRESGSLEQDADVVMFLYREEYYNRDDPANENIAEVIIAKNRNGPTTAVRLHFDKAIMKFGNLTRAAD